MGRRRRKYNFSGPAAGHVIEARSSAKRAADGAKIAMDFANEGKCDMAFQAVIDAEISHGIGRREASYSGMPPAQRHELFARPGQLVQAARERVVGLCTCPIESGSKTRYR